MAAGRGDSASEPTGSAAGRLPTRAPGTYLHQQLRAWPTRDPDAALNPRLLQRVLQRLQELSDP